jgi:transcriptional regulator with XRE-family HTH domain
VNDLLVLLGKRVHELRAAKKWSQEEFAHISGFHRTYIGQVERGEKNISFDNLSKVAGVLGVTLSELLAGLEDGSTRDEPAKRDPRSRMERDSETPQRALELQRLAKRLRLQGEAINETIQALDGLAAGSSPKRKSSQRKPSSRRSRVSS